MLQRERLRMEDDKRLYLVPVRDNCNASCSFCYMKEKKKDYSKPQFISVDSLRNNVKSIENKFNEVEITGGGEPILHSKIGEIVDLFDDKYVKIYTNGFILKSIEGVNEINISRIHWDSKVNNEFYNSKFQNDLEDVVDFYRPLVDKIRMQTILLKGAIDSEEKALEFIEKFEDRVDAFMFRTLFDGCSLLKDKYVDYFPIKHSKVKLDKTLDNYDRSLFFIGTDSVVHDEFQF